MISGKRYISTRRAGKEYHYHSDYIGQLIRAGKVAGQKVGRAWYVSEASLAAHLREEAAERKSGKPTLAPAASKSPAAKKADETASEKTAKPVMSVEEVRHDVQSEQPAIPAKKPPPHISEAPGVILSGNLQKPRIAELKLLKYIPERGSDPVSDHEEEIALHRTANIPAVDETRSSHVEIDRDHYIERERERNLPKTPSSPWHANRDAIPHEDIPVPIRITTRSQVPAQSIRSTEPAYRYQPEFGIYASAPVHRGQGNARLAAAIVILGSLALAAGFAASLAPLTFF